MIAYLSGKILQKARKHLIIESNGVGYLVAVSKEILETAQTGEIHSLYIHTAVREDDIELFGFEQFEQWNFFKLLITVSGVGPRLGMDILSAPLSRVKQAIARKDIAFLVTIPGIGKKTAERISVDLAEKIELGDVADLGTAPSPVHEEIFEAIENLGYKRHHISRVLQDAPALLKTSEEIITYFLRHV